MSTSEGTYFPATTTAASSSFNHNNNNNNSGTVFRQLWENENLSWNEHVPDRDDASYQYSENGGRALQDDEVEEVEEEEEAEEEEEEDASASKKSMHSTTGPISSVARLEALQKRLSRPLHGIMFDLLGDGKGSVGLICRGRIVEAVVEGSSAWLSGLCRAGDVIEAVDGHKITEAHEPQSMLMGRIGTAITVQLRRPKGKTFSVSLVRHAGGLRRVYGNHHHHHHH